MASQFSWTIVDEILINKVESQAGDVVGIEVRTPGDGKPGTVVMFGTGVIGLAGLLRRRFNV